MTIANMTTEWGALVGWFPVDEVTIALAAKRATRSCARKASTRITEENLQEWRDESAAPRCGRRLRRAHRARISRR